MNRWFVLAQKILTPKEWMIGLVSILISGMIMSSVIWMPSSSIHETFSYEYLGLGLRVETIPIGDQCDSSDSSETSECKPKKISPFYTIFRLLYESLRPRVEIARARTIVETMVPHLHQLADRHYDYYADESKTTLVNNIKRVNETLLTDEAIEIDVHLYEMLRIGVAMGKLTNGQFNMFIGEVSAFWNDLIDDPEYGENVESWDPFYNEVERAKLDRYVSFLPMTEQDFDEVLTLTDNEGVYTAKLNSFKGAQMGDLSISLGAIAKGYANDVIASMLKEEQLIYGHINNGASSILALGEKSNGEPYRWDVTSPSILQDYAFSIDIQGAHGLSTSGSYNGRVVSINEQPTLRHHIIDPSTGYPSDYVYEINALSSDLPSVYLDILTTALMTMPLEEGLAIHQHFIDLGFDLNLSWIDILPDTRLSVTYTTDFHDYIIPIDGVVYQKLS